MDAIIIYQPVLVENCLCRSENGTRDVLDSLKSDNRI